MKKYWLLIYAMISYQLLFSQYKDFSNHQLSVDFGSFRNRYLYPITDIRYSSPLLKNINLKFSARLRSYGTLYFYSNSAYDITPIAEYYFAKTIKPVYFSVGIGMDIRLRFVNGSRDERSDATSSAEPLISLAIYGNYKKISFRMPLWTRFYSNGISFAVLPEMSIRVSKRFSIFARYELTYLTIYDVNSYGWQRDCFIGSSILF